MTQYDSNNPGLFRENALKNLNAIDQIESAFQVIQPAAWLWILIVMCFFISLATWGIMGNVSTHVKASGIILSASQLEQTERQIKQEIAQRQAKLSAMKTLLEQKRELYHKHYLTITDLEQSEDAYVAAEEDLINFSNKGHANTNLSVFSRESVTTSVDLEALVFVSQQEGKKIRAGMAALIIPETLSAYKYGYIEGTVISISHYPASKDAIYAYLGNINLVDEFFAGGVPFMVKIKLGKNPQSASGLRWTTRDGAPFRIESGTRVFTRIINKKLSPLSILIKKDESES